MASSIVSVVMSVFNGQAFLSEAIESTLSQTFCDFEFRVVDDGSTAATAGILSTYAGRDARMRIFRHENKRRQNRLMLDSVLPWATTLRGWTPMTTRCPTGSKCKSTLWNATRRSASWVERLSQSARESEA